uniref:glycosyltransferase family 2 protein n=1 Tax=Acinetobacter bereziniae TaxID=106648 RepID=UPI0012509CAD
MKSLDIQVSVCIVTYNQEKYIAECLDSLLSQKTDFKFEIIVGEDCSTDGTRAVIQKYIDQYPELIVPLFYEANVGPVENLKRVYKKARGRYIAHMDGDDLALPNKLQKQFSILEMNPDCSICVHNMNAIDGKSQKMNRAFSLFDEKKYSLLDMYLINPFFIHSSKMFVNKIDDYIDQLNENALDIEVHIEQAKQGDIYFIGECLGVYRQFVGVTYEEKLINPLIPERIQDVYYNFPSEKFNVKDISKVKKKYAYILLQYTNHYILHGDLM